MEIYCIIAILLLILLIILFNTKNNRNKEEFMNYSIYPQEVYVTNYHKPITKNIAWHQMAHTIAKNKTYYGGYKGTCKHVDTCNVQLEPCPEFLPYHYQNCQDLYENCHKYKDLCPKPKKKTGKESFGYNLLADEDFENEQQRAMCMWCPRTCKTCDRKGGCPWPDSIPPPEELTKDGIVRGKTLSCSQLQKLENAGYNDLLEYTNIGKVVQGGNPSEGSELSMLERDLRRPKAYDSASKQGKAFQRDIAGFGMTLIDTLLLKSGFLDKEVEEKKKNMRLGCISR